MSNKLKCGSGVAEQAQSAKSVDSIQQSLQDLRSRLAETESMLTALEEDIDPILTPEDNETSEEVKSPGGIPIEYSLLNTSLGEAHRSLDHIQMKITWLRNRIEL